MPIVDFSLAGKTAIVTGGSRGIGRAIAIGLGEAGANVVIGARKPESLAEAVEAVNAAPEFMVGRQWLASQREVDPVRLGDVGIPVKDV